MYNMYIHVLTYVFSVIVLLALISLVHVLISNGSIWLDHKSVGSTRENHSVLVQLDLLERISYHINWIFALFPKVRRTLLVPALVYMGLGVGR
jgi:hypothetical protein